jgi:hypothetical protein
MKTLRQYATLQKPSVVFEREAPSHARFWTACKHDARLWSCRWPVHERLVGDAWCASFSSMCKQTVFYAFSLKSQM